MGCGDEKLSKYLTQTFTAHCNAMICQQVTLSGDAEWPKVADAVIEANEGITQFFLQHAGISIYTRNVQLFNGVHLFIRYLMRERPATKVCTSFDPRISH